MWYFFHLIVCITVMAGTPPPPLDVRCIIYCLCSFPISYSTASIMARPYKYDNLNVLLIVSLQLMPFPVTVTSC